MRLIADAASCVDFAFLCDAADAGEGGKLAATGIGIDTFEARMLPGVLPLLFVARLSGLESPVELALRAIDADGSAVTCLPLRNTVQPAAEGRVAKTPLMARVYVPVERAGDFRLDVAVDDGVVHSVPFWVTAPSV